MAWQPPLMIDALEDVSGAYSLLLCDVWGVVHNGVRPYDRGCAALTRARSQGKTVVLITNSPRRADAVSEQMVQIGVPDDAWDAIVTSGDVTRRLIAEGAKRIFHIGTEAELHIYDGLDVELVSKEEADVIVSTGLINDEEETLDDYDAMLNEFAARELPMICANPDLKVRRGDIVVPCAGALAQAYEERGGLVRVAGKPHGPIYDAALDLAANSAGRSFAKSDALAIGDGVPTDVRGAIAQNIDCLFVTGGEASIEGDIDTFELLKAEGMRPVAAMTQLV
ncbi:TIGR01459 family HAD-type hydrolase [Notoacmeibacter ruber]|uniref:TIGR01459 family HAD-type hydrolase n=1 Tax=Notoacmeibacter ruber TaxID=2670375 RepID=A0A3L7J9Y0_9HYPH|nr:TIGR01459 family HAD-type hydrolase [Notoacmeibacter ruber]RLQ87269.1 TIGR01459 family HAD-type hydrolase [Notoacmeibacter ruber]